MKKIMFIICVCTIGILLLSCNSHSHELNSEWNKDSINHWHVCTGCEELLDIEEHSFGEWKVVTNATESSKGLEKRVCTVCSYEENKEISMLPHEHTFSSNWNHDSAEHWRECACGEVIDKAKHKGGEATETAKAVCDICNIAYGEFKEHVHSYEDKFDETYHWIECACGDVIEKEEHSGGQATTTLKAICDICKQEYGDYLKSEYGEVSFVDIKVYPNGYDGVVLRPYFTNPELCTNEKFTYTAEHENYCYIENNKVYYLKNGTTKVVAKSEHFEKIFYVYSMDFSFTSKANAHVQRLGGMYQGEETLFIGDSFFEFWENGTNGIKTFAKSFGEYKAFNIGISGSTTHDWRAINYKLSTKVKTPKNIIINLGTNNINLKGENGAEVSGNLIALIKDYLELFPDANIYYLSITRCHGSLANNWAKAEESNRILSDYCKNIDRVYYLDVMSLYGDNYASYLYDGLHPNQAGYNLFEKIIKENVPFDEK